MKKWYLVGFAAVALLMGACSQPGEQRQSVVGPTINCPKSGLAASRVGDISQPTNVDCGDVTPAPVIVPPVIQN